MASPSSSALQRSIASPKIYDVFISHRGPDVKETFAKTLYERLQERGCRAFLDRKELEGGDSIPSAIHNAICSSRVQIAIFSKGYAESSWCLDELVLMLQQTDALFIPVFYDVHPWELRHIDDKKKKKKKGKKKKSQYAAAFSEYRSKGRNLDKLEEWKQALSSAADISGYELSQYQDNLCEEIVSRAVKAVQEKEKSIPLYVAKYPVGLDELVEDFERSCSKMAGIVGIFGLGGSGKTTLSKELLNKKRSSYTASCFLSDVRESDARGELHRLQSQLLKDLLGEKEEIRDKHHGIGKLNDRLGRAKSSRFLIILDDIDHKDQLDALLPEGVLGCGSLAIITTRDQSVLRGADFSYKMKGMEEDRAKNLFCSHAFGRRDPPPAYEKLVESFVEFCGGLLLSLMVLVAHVYGRDEHYWDLELKKVMKIQPKDIMQRLKISFDGLDTEEKQIFIDIACFFNKLEQYRYIQGNWKLKSKAITIWKASGWNAEHVIQTLQEKCLLEVDVKGANDIFIMHDHLRDLGRHMAEELGPPRLWQPALLRSMEAKGFKQILAETKGRCFNHIRDSSIQGQLTYFTADTELLWLEIHSSLDSYSNRIPPWIPIQKLHCLVVAGVSNLWSSFQQQLQSNIQVSFELRWLQIWSPPSLEKVPDLIKMCRHLEVLYIGDSLKNTDTTSLMQSLKQLHNLRSLRLCSINDNVFRGNLDLSESRDSSNLDCSRSSRLDSLEIIRLSYLQNVSKLLISGDMCPRLNTLQVWQCHNLKEMELKQLESLNTLRVLGCYNLKEMEFKQQGCHNLKEMEFSQCCELETISGLSTLTGLQVLIVEYCRSFYRLSSLAHLRHLEKITIVVCDLNLKRVLVEEGVDELPGLKSMVIGCAGVRNDIPRLKRLPVKKTILFQDAMLDASSKLNSNLFSEVVGDQEVSEIERGKYELKIKGSSSAITIYALLVTSGDKTTIHFESEKWWLGRRQMVITILLTQHGTVGHFGPSVTIEKGFKATMNVGEEGKALSLLKRIVDRLYT